MIEQRIMCEDLCFCFLFVIYINVFFDYVISYCKIFRAGLMNVLYFV